MELLTADEVAKLLKCSLEFVYKNRALLGGIKIGRLVRFQLNKIEEVVNGSLPAPEQLDVRLCEEQQEIQAGRISDQEGSRGSRSQGKNPGSKDKYGLLEALHFPAGRTRITEK